MKQYKVIQWGAGFTGAFSLRYILANPALQLVGVKCHTEEKQGMDAGTIAGVSPCGVLATRSASDLLSLQADCVIFMPRDPLVSARSILMRTVGRYLLVTLTIRAANFIELAFSRRL